MVFKRNQEQTVAPILGGSNSFETSKASGSYNSSLISTTPQPLKPTPQILMERKNLWAASWVSFWLKINGFRWQTMVCSQVNRSEAIYFQPQPKRTPMAPNTLPTPPKRSKNVQQTKGKHTYVPPYFLVVCRITWHPCLLWCRKPTLHALARPGLTNVPPSTCPHAGGTPPFLLAFKGKPKGKLKGRPLRHFGGSHKKS